MFLRKAFLLTLLLASGSLPVFAAGPSIVLITIDTARADRMGFLGSKEGLTPNLDALARRSVVFTHAYAHVPLTTPSHATILTGTYPQFNHLNDLGTPLAKDIPYLPDILHKHGYQTAAFVGSQVLDPKSAAVPGFERGFDTYDADFHSRQPGEDRYHSVERRAMVVVDHASSWIHQHSNSRSPFFVWVHVYDPHDPYDPPAPFKAQYADAPYNGEIAYVDHTLGKLLTGLRTHGLYGQTLIAVAADHGEAFGEHDEKSHGFFLYDETIHVPLLVKLPNERTASARVEASVGLVDIAPALLQAVGIDVPPAMQGESLLNLTKTRTGRGPASAAQVVSPVPSRSMYSETNYPQRAFGWSALYSLRAGKYLYIDAPERELYDLTEDPKASHNLATTSKAVANTMAAQLEEFRRKTSRAKTAEPDLNTEDLEKLQALGYVSSGLRNAGQETKERGPDPKSKIQIANLLHEALLAMEDDRYNDAVPKLDRVLEEEPSMPLANLELGRAWNSLEKYDKALPWLRKAVDLTPESGRAHFELGMALGETGDWAGAAKHLEAAVKHAPDSDELHFDLATAYEHLARISNATEEFQAALRLNPDHYKANLMFGRLLGMHDQPMAALPYLQKAIQLQPISPDAHKFLANVYIELGEKENAIREQTEADRLKALSKP